MVRHYITLISLLFTLLWGQECFAQQYTFAKFDFYADSNKVVGQPAKGEKRVVLMGNSITEFWVGTHPEFFSENKLIGRGISGQTSFQMLLRFHEDVINLKPRVVVICCGTNDIAENAGPYVEDFSMNNIMAMCEMAAQNKIKVILCSIPPHHTFFWHPDITGIMPKIESLNRRIRAYAESKKIPFVDYFSAMLSDDGSRMSESLSSDGVHPNLKGYEIMESLLLPVITKERK